MKKKFKYFSEKEINKVSFGVDNGFDYMDITFMHMLDLLREVLGEPMVLTCAYRSKAWDMKLSPFQDREGKARSGNSDHCHGKGVDVKVKDMAHMLRMATEASKIGFNSFGYNQELGFLHIGKRDKLNVTTWNY